MIRFPQFTSLAIIFLVATAAHSAGTGVALSKLAWSPKGEEMIFRVEFAGTVIPRAHDELLEKKYYYVDFYGVSGAEEKQSWSVDHPAVRHAKRIFYEKQKVMRLVFYPPEGGGARFAFEGSGRKFTVRATPGKQIAAGKKPRGKGARKVVVIDPGHGGTSSGALSSKAIGGRVQYEKDIVLQVARRLIPLFERSPDIDCILTRTGDTYVSLNDRIRIADRANGDLFVSLHMNATQAAVKSARGLEIYYLSDEQKATNREIEEIENDRSHKLEVKSSSGADVKAILASLSDDNFRRRRQESVMASMVFDQTFRSQGPFRGASRGVKDAAFRVLMNSNMPSILCELGFIDNVEDATMMLDPDKQEQVAALLFNAINEYFARTDSEFAAKLVPVPKGEETTVRWRQAQSKP